MPSPLIVALGAGGVAYLLTRNRGEAAGPDAVPNEGLKRYDATKADGDHDALVDTDKGLAPPPGHGAPVDPSGVVSEPAGVYGSAQANTTAIAGSTNNATFNEAHGSVIGTYLGKPKSTGEIAKPIVKGTVSQAPSQQRAPSQGPVATLGKKLEGLATTYHVTTPKPGTINPTKPCSSCAPKVTSLQVSAQLKKATSLFSNRSVF